MNMLVTVFTKLVFCLVSSINNNYFKLLVPENAGTKFCSKLRLYYHTFTKEFGYI